MKKKLIYLMFAFAGVASVSSCSEDLLDPTLAQDKSVEGSIASVEDLQGIIYGAYNRMSNSAYYGRDYIIFGEVRGDNTFANASSGRFLDPAAMDLTESSAYSSDTWTQLYAVIASANIIIAQDPESLEGDIEEIQHLQGQAYAIRALAHFDLLKLYGQQHVNGGGDAATGIPYVTEYKGENLLPARNSVSEVKGFIYDDLSTAEGLMSADYNSTCEVISTYAVDAITSRVGIYFGDWQVAADAAKAVIDSGEFIVAPAANWASTWSTDCPPNVIFEIANSPTDNPGINGLAYIYRGSSYGDIEVLPTVLDLFDEGDIRGSDDAIGYVEEDGVIVDKLSNLAKYPNMEGFDNIPVIRYEEVILNYAEALFELGSTEDALTYLNMIPENRGLGADYFDEATKVNILEERRRELLFEGFRFDDLARNSLDIPLVDEFLQTHGGPAYGSYNYAFPIPLNELNANANINQNEGY